MIPLRFTSLFLASALLSVVALAGCSESGIAHDAVFAKATPEQIDRVYEASSGFDLSMMLSMADNMAGRNDPTGCPAIVTQGTVTTVTGGCTTEDGVRFEGSIVIRDLPNIDRIPLEGPAETGSVELDLRVTGADGESGALEGRVEVDRDDLDMDIRGDLTITWRGVVSTSRLELSYGSDGTTTVAPGSEMTHSELGSASVEGSWHLGDPPSGALMLRGADELVFDIAHRGEDRCVPYAAGENRGAVCDALFEPRRAARFDQAQVLAAQPSSRLSQMLLRAKR